MRGGGRERSCLCSCVGGSGGVFDSSPKLRCTMSPSRGFFLLCSLCCLLCVLLRQAENVFKIFADIRCSSPIYSNVASSWLDVYPTGRTLRLPGAPLATYRQQHSPCCRTPDRRCLFRFRLLFSFRRLADSACYVLVLRLNSLTCPTNCMCLVCCCACGTAGTRGW